MPELRNNEIRILQDALELLGRFDYEEGEDQQFTFSADLHPDLFYSIKNDLERLINRNT